MPKPQLTYCHKKCATLSVKGDTLSLQLKLGLCNKCHIFFVNCTQFEIVGLANNVRYIGDFPCLTIINGQKIYNRLLIKRVS